MPIKRVAKLRTARGDHELRHQLAEEWRRPHESGDGWPVIYEEGGGQQRPLHVYVVWESWKELDQVERSEIILDAYEDVYGEDAALNVTVAMGLTREEARRMGIDVDA